MKWSNMRYMLLNHKLLKHLIDRYHIDVSKMDMYKNIMSSLPSLREGNSVGSDITFEDVFSTIKIAGVMIPVDKLNFSKVDIDRYLAWEQEMFGI